MWLRARKNRENASKATHSELITPIPSDIARGLGSSALFSHSTEESGQPNVEIQAFDQLRIDTHARMRADYAHRLATNPTPTAQERSLGMYAENLEPQVRNAIFGMRQKGYLTNASGFFHGDTTWRTLGIEGEDVPWGTYEHTINPFNKRAQTMDFSGGFALDQATINKLFEVGAEAIYHPADGLIHRIGFVPENPDLHIITANWDAIATILPVTGNIVQSAETFNADFADWGATTSY